jgi:hypothetical protein
VAWLESPNALGATAEFQMRGRPSSLELCDSLPSLHTSGNERTETTPPVKQSSAFLKDQSNHRFDSTTASRASSLMRRPVVQRGPVSAGGRPNTISRRLCYALNVEIAQLPSAERGASARNHSFLLMEHHPTNRRTIAESFPRSRDEESRELSEYRALRYRRGCPRTDVVHNSF